MIRELKRIKSYRYLGYARNNPARFKATSKTALIKKLKKKSPIFAKGIKTYDFEEVI